MPNLVDIVEVAEALESKAVYLASDRCVAVRNRHSSCAKCADACPTGAVFAADNVLSLDAETCVACGACTTACPTEALIPLRPLDEDLASAVVAGVANTGGTAVFACARIASKHVGDPTKYAEVPCLARMEESVLLAWPRAACATSCWWTARAPHAGSAATSPASTRWWPRRTTSWRRRVRTSG